MASIARRTKVEIQMNTKSSLSQAMEVETCDLVIVGARMSFSAVLGRHIIDSKIGIHGLTMLKNYRNINPQTSIVVLDNGTSLGGV